MDAPVFPPDGDRDRSSVLFAILFAPLFIAIILLTARGYVRYRIKGLGLDDFFMFASFFVWIPTIAISTVFAQHGGCRHVVYLQPGQIIDVLRYSFIAQALGIVTPVLGKISVGLIIMGIMGPSTVWRKWFLHGLLFIYVVLSVLAVIFTFVKCNPVKANWMPLLPGTICWNPEAYIGFVTAQSSYGTFIDFVLALLPITIVWGLKLPVAKKMAICVLLGLGVFAGICAAVKTMKLKNFGSKQDFTWAIFDIFAWAQAEVALVIICGCVPTLKPLYDLIVRGNTLGPVGGYRQAYDNGSYKLNTAGQRSMTPGHSSNVTTLGRKGKWEASNSARSAATKDLTNINVERSFEVAHQSTGRLNISRSDDAA